MATHYSQGLNSSSCGRTGATLATTQDRDQVSCKTCLRSLGKATAVPEVASKAPAAPSQAVKAATAEPARTAPRAKQPTAKKSMKVSASASWRNRLAQIPGRNRLPRGARQAFI